MINPLTYINRMFRRAQPALNPRSLRGGRVSVNSSYDFPSSNWLLMPPTGYENNWQLLTLDSKYLDRIEPTRLMEMLADLSPEVSRGLWDFQRMCNPGWTAMAYKADGETQDKAAQGKLDEFLSILKERHGSVDVVVNRLFMQPFLRGAFAAELVLDERGRMPLELATPDPASIRFRQRTDQLYGPLWQPGQWQAYSFVPLDIPTFSYLPIDPMPGSPYGRPMAAPALFTSLFLLGMFHDLKRVIQQQGYPRLDLIVKTKEILESAPHLANDAEAFTAFVQSLVNEVENVYSQLKPDDAYIHPDTVEVNRPVGAIDASSLAGIDKIIIALERMAARALKTMPLLMGITDAVGDVQSNRQWEVYAVGIKSMQKYAEAILDRLLKLALRVQGIQADVWFRFEEVRSAEELRDAQVAAMKIANAKAKYEAGWISQDEASEEVTGHPADQPAPVMASVSNPDLVQDNNDSQEVVRSEWITEIRAARDDVAMAMDRIAMNGYHAN